MIAIDSNNIDFFEFCYIVFNNSIIINYPFPGPPISYDSPVNFMPKQFPSHNVKQHLIQDSNHNREQMLSSNSGPNDPFATRVQQQNSSYSQWDNPAAETVDHGPTGRKFNNNSNNTPQGGPGPNGVNQNQGPSPLLAHNNLNRGDCPHFGSSSISSDMSFGPVKGGSAQNASKRNSIESGLDSHSDSVPVNSES